jgi:hypothetical protein
LHPNNGTIPESSRRKLFVNGRKGQSGRKTEVECGAPAIPAAFAGASRAKRYFMFMLLAGMGMSEL